MKNLVILSALAGVMGLALPVTQASAEPWRRCTTEKRCTWHHGKKICKVVRVCRSHHNHDHH